MKSLSSSTPVRKIRRPEIEGEDSPMGIGVFQATFELGPNCTGRPVSSATPAALTPRNCGQSSATPRRITNKAHIVGDSIASAHVFFGRVIAVAGLTVALCSPAESQDKPFHPKGKPPSEHTIEVLEQARTTLPFADTRDFEEQKKGFIAAPDSKKIMADAGHVVFIHRWCASPFST